MGNYKNLPYTSFMLHEMQKPLFFSGVGNPLALANHNSVPIRSKKTKSYLLEKKRISNLTKTLEDGYDS